MLWDDHDIKDCKLFYRKSATKTCIVSVTGCSNWVFYFNKCQFHIGSFPLTVSGKQEGTLACIISQKRTGTSEDKYVSPTCTHMCPEMIYLLFADTCRGFYTWCLNMQSYIKNCNVRHKWIHDNSKHLLF